MTICQCSPFVNPVCKLKFNFIWCCLASIWPGTQSADETDSNADTCCLGNNFVILEHTIKQVDGCAHDKSIEPLSNAPVVSGAAAWNDSVTNQTCILVVNETLRCGAKSDHSLINPNQIQSFGINHWDNPFDASRPVSIRPLDFDSIVPLTAVGTKIQFLSRAPTSKELAHCPHIQLTSEID